MDIQIHSQNFVSDNKLRTHIEQRLRKLLTYNDKIIHAEVHMKLSSHQQVRDKTVDVKVHVPGQVMFASDTSKAFEESLDKAIDSLRSQIKRHKEKSIEHS